LKKPDVESDPLLQEIYVCLAKIHREAPPGSGFQHSQTAHDRQAGLPRCATRLPFIQEDEVGAEALGQQDGAALAGAEAMACQRQQWIRLRFSRYHLNPASVPHFLGSGKTTPDQGHFMVDFGRDQDAFVE